MIQIDDAGSGSFVGGTCIGIYRPEGNDYYFEIIPVEFYDSNNFKTKLYLSEVAEIVKRAFAAMSVKRSESIEICRGYMFEKARAWLDKCGYSFYCTHIDGRIQEIVEKSFELYTISLGLPKEYIKYTKYPFHFHKLLRWVFADYQNRLKLCKVGWKSWQKIEGIRLEEYSEKVYTPHFICMKCGEYLLKGSTARVLRYNGKRPDCIYMHQQC